MISLKNKIKSNGYLIMYKDKTLLRKLILLIGNIDNKSYYGYKDI